MTKRLLALVLSAGLSLGTATATHADDAQANTLFVGAVKALQAAPAAGPAPERLEAVQSALAAFDRIVAEHPASSLAVSIITGQPIGAIDVGALRSEAETLKTQIAAEAARAAEAQEAAAASSAALGDNAACLADPACAAEKLIAAADGDNDYRGLVMRKRSASVLEVVAGRGAALLESYEANLLPAVEDLPRGAEAQGYMAALHWLAISGEQQAVRDHLDTLREGDFPDLTPEQAAKLHRQTVTMLVTTALGASDIELARFWADGAGYDNLEGEALLETYFKRVARSSPADIESWMASGVEGLTGYKDWAVQAATAYLVMKDDPRAVEAAAVFDEMTKDPSGRVVAVYRSVGDTEAAAAELDKIMAEEQPFSDLVQMARAAAESGDVTLGREVLALFQQLPPFESDDKYKRFSVAEGAFRASALAALP